MTRETPQRTGLRTLAARRPLSVFLVLVFGVGWPVLAVPVLAGQALIVGRQIPPEFFALAVTSFVMLPTAFCASSLSEPGPYACC